MAIDYNDWLLCIKSGFSNLKHPFYYEVQIAKGAAILTSFMFQWARLANVYCFFAGHTTRLDNACKAKRI